MDPDLEMDEATWTVDALFDDSPMAEPMTDVAFVEMTYEAVLGRSTGPGEVAVWLPLFDLGLSRVDVLTSIVHSPESILRTKTLPPN